MTATLLHAPASTPVATSARPSPKPRILIFDHTAALGGGEIALLNLVRELRDSPFDVKVLLGSDGDLVSKLTDIGCPPDLLPMDASVVHTRKESLGAGGIMQLRKAASVAAYASRLANYLRENRIDLLHTNSLKSDVVGALAGRLARVPVLWHVRDRICTEYLPRPAVALFQALSRFLPNYIVANSAATLTTLPRRAGSYVVHDGVEALPPLPEIPPLSGAAPIIGLVGRITRWKGQHVFLRAAAGILKSFPNARFQIVGAALFDEKPYEAEIQALTDSLNISHAVEFTGFRPDVADLVARMDIVVHASITGEPFGQVIIEAMAAGRPVIATRGGGVPEIIIDNESGLLVPMGDADEMCRAACRLLRNPHLAREIGAAGRRRVASSFLIRHTAARMKDIYAAVLRNAS